jgi:VCBS repeat-containing protein
MQVNLSSSNSSTRFEGGLIYVWRNGGWVLQSGSYNDQAADTLMGGNGADTIGGLGSNDLLVGGNGADSVSGGGGADTIAGDGTSVLDKTNGSDSLDGGDGADSIFGGNGDDRMVGGADNDSINGGNGADYFRGDTGADVLTGGRGGDRFAYTGSSAGVSPDAAGSRDCIVDFNRSEGDRIDFTGLTLTGSGAPPMPQWSGSGPAPWSVWVDTVAGGTSIVRVDTDGDGVADIAIEVKGFVGMNADDFINVNEAPDIFVGSGDDGAETLTETNAGLTYSETLTVRDPDLADTVTATVLSVSKTGTTTGLVPDDAALKAMMTVTSGQIAADPTHVNNVGWTFNSGTEAFNYLAGDETLTLTYRIRVSDGNGGTDTQDVVITIDGTNDGPVITVGALDSAGTTIAETDVGLTESGTLTVRDPDVSDEVTASVASVATGGTVVGLVPNNDALKAMMTVTGGTFDADPGDSNNLGWTFDSGSEAFDYLAGGETLTLTYSVEVDDDNGGTDAQDVVVNITGTNDGPAITVGADDDDAETLTETNAGLSYGGSLTVRDPDVSDEVTASVASVTTGGVDDGLVPDNAALKAMMTVTALPIAADPGTAGNLDWDFNSGTEAFDYLADGETLTLTYSIEVDDGHGGIDSKDVVISIAGTNDGPAISLQAGDTAAATLAETDGAQNADGTLTVRDPDLSDSVTATVAEVTTDGPTNGILSDTLKAMMTVTAGPIDADPGDSNNLDWDFDSNGEAFDYLAGGETLTLTYSIEVEDGSGSTDAEDVVISITGTNDGPTISVGAGDDATETLTETDAGLSYGATLTVRDPDLSDTVTATVTGVVASGTTAGLVPNNAALKAMMTVTAGAIDADPGDANNIDWTFDSGSQAFNYLNPGQTLTLTYTIQVSDGNGGTDTQDVVINISGSAEIPSNAAPVAEDDAWIVSDATVVTFAKSAVLGNDDDADDDDLSVVGTSFALYTQAGAATGGSVAFNGTNFTFTSGAAGNYYFDYVVTDGLANDTGRVFIDVVDTSNTGNSFDLATRTVWGGFGAGEYNASFIDLLNGGDSLAGGDGNDTVAGGGGEDTVNGSGGADSITGGGDGDTLSGGEGDDTLRGDGGTDSIDGGGGNDSIAGDDAGDTLSGGGGNDTIVGGAGADSLSGGDGNDSLAGGGGDDTLNGGIGIDTFRIDASSDRVDYINGFTVGAGGDKLDFSAWVASSANTTGKSIGTLISEGWIIVATGAVTGVGGGAADTTISFDSNGNANGGSVQTILYLVDTTGLTNDNWIV